MCRQIKSAFIVFAIPTNHLFGKQHIEGDERSPWNNYFSHTLRKNIVIHDRQYSFRQRRSTGDMLTYLWSSVIEWFGKTEVVPVDVSEAVDIVSNNSFLIKLVACRLYPELCIEIGSLLPSCSYGVNSQTRRIMGVFRSDAHNTLANTPRHQSWLPWLLQLEIIYLSYCD